MTSKTLRDLVLEDDKLRLFNLTKYNKYDKNTWEFEIIDKRSPYAGVVGYLTDYRYQMTTLRHNSHFFLIRDLWNQIQSDARIIFIGSLMAVHPHATSLPYGVAKSALHALAKNLLKDFEGTNVTINTIAPGFVGTEWQKNKPQEIKNNIYNKTALHRFATPDEIAEVVKFLLHNPFVNGDVIEVSGGYSYK